MYVCVCVYVKVYIYIYIYIYTFFSIISTYCIWFIFESALCRQNKISIFSTKSIKIINKKKCSSKEKKEKEGWNGSNVKEISGSLSKTESHHHCPAFGGIFNQIS